MRVIGADADADGFLYFRGRVDDRMNVASENVYPQTVEALIAGHPGVADVAVVAAPHGVKGEVPVAFVVAQPAVTLDPQEIKQFCLDNGPAFAHPRLVVVLDSLPVGTTGKVDRGRLGQLAAAGGGFI